MTTLGNKNYYCVVFTNKTLLMIKIKQNAIKLKNVLT